MEDGRSLEAGSRRSSAASVSLRPSSNVCASMEVSITSKNLLCRDGRLARQSRSGETPVSPHHKTCEVASSHSDFFCTAGVNHASESSSPPYPRTPSFPLPVRPNYDYTCRASDHLSQLQPARDKTSALVQHRPYDRAT